MVPDRGATALGRVATLFLQTPGRVVALMVATYVTLWSIAQALLMVSPRRDTVEIIAFSPFWPLGIYKHPPLPIWMQEVAMRLSGDWVGSTYVLSAACVGAMLVFVWLIGRDMVGSTFGALAAALTLANVYFLEPVTQFNNDIASLPFWAAAVFFYRRGVVGGRLLPWLGFGVAAAAALLAKYSASFLLAGLAAHLLATPEGRAALRRPWPWLAVATVLLLMAPHLRWLAETGFGALEHPFDRQVGPAGFGRALVFGGSFLLQQVTPHLPILALVLIAWLVPARSEPAMVLDRPPVGRFDAWLLAVATLVPLLVTTAFIVATASRSRGYWGASYFETSGLAILALLPRRLTIRAPGFAAGAWLAILLATPFLVCGAFHAYPAVTGREPPALFPAPDLARQLARRWRESTGDAPLRIVIGPPYQGPAIAAFLRPRPLVLQGGNPQYAPPMAPGSVDREGALLVWEEDPAAEPGSGGEPYGPYSAAATITGPPVEARRPAWSRKPPYRFGWAIIPPQGGGQTPPSVGPAQP